MKDYRLAVSRVRLTNFLHTVLEPDLEKRLRSRLIRWIIVGNLDPLCLCLNVAKDPIIQNLVCPGSKTDRNIKTPILPDYNRQGVLNDIFGILVVPNPMVRQDAKSNSQKRK
jgi:hypothetical protein